MWFTLISDTFQKKMSLKFIYLLLRNRGPKLGFAFLAMIIDSKYNKKKTPLIMGETLGAPEFSFSCDFSL